jgi:hypothetical protein
MEVLLDIGKEEASGKDSQKKKKKIQGIRFKSEEIILLHRLKV